MTDSDKVISDNAECVRSRFSKKVMQDRLMGCYLNLLKQDVDMQVSGPQGAGYFWITSCFASSSTHVELRRLLDEG